MEIFPGISMDAGIRFGKPCLTGTRIDVATVLGGLASGASVEQLELEYQLSRDWHETIFEVLDGGKQHPWERPRQTTTE